MKYVRPGEPIRNSAAERNEIAENVNFVRDVLRNSQSGILDPTVELPCIVDVSNSTGTNFERHEAVYVSAPIITPTDNVDEFAKYRRYVILSPTGWDHLGRLAILLEPIPSGRIGKAVISGTVQTKVNIIEEWHEYADVEEVSGGRTLQSNPDGSSTCQILWKESGTGEKWATVRLSNAGQFHLVGKPTGYGISAASDYSGVRTPGTGTIQVYYLDPSTEELTALEDPNGDPCYLTVYNLGTSTIATTEWVLPHCDRWGVWWVEPATPIFYRAFKYDLESHSTASGLLYTFDNPSVNANIVFQPSGDNDFEQDTTVSPYEIKCLTTGLYPIWARLNAEASGGGGGSGKYTADSYVEFWVAKLSGSTKTREPYSWLSGQCERIHYDQTVGAPTDCLGVTWSYVSLTSGDYLGMAYQAVGDSSITWQGGGQLLVGPRLG